MRDVRTLQALLDGSGIQTHVEGNLQSLQNSEVSLARDFENRYNLLLYYLPVDLKGFFEKCRILWDVENLKLLLCNIIDAKSQRDIVQMAGPLGYLDQEDLESLAGANNPEEMIAFASRLLPFEYSTRLTLEKWPSGTRDLELALDFAAFSFLQGANEEIGTQRVELAWKVLENTYEIKNILTISRLKLSKTASEKIEPLLFPVFLRLEKSEYTSLLEAEDHPSFMHALEKTYYGKWLLESRDNTKVLEDLSRRTVRVCDAMEAESEVERIIRFMTELEVHYETIRKATFLASVKTVDEE